HDGQSRKAAPVQWRALSTRGCSRTRLPSPSGTTNIMTRMTAATTPREETPRSVPSSYATPPRIGRPPDGPLAKKRAMRLRDTRSAGEGLERSCQGTVAGWLASSRLAGGVELFSAWFVGEAYRKTSSRYVCDRCDRKVFDYRGFVHASTPGQVDRAVSGRDPRQTRGHPRGGVRKSSDFETPRTRFTSFLHWRIERALDLDDVVLVQAMDLDDGAGRIGALAPKLGLDLIDDRPEAVHVGSIDDKPHGVAKARALGFRNQLHVQQSLADAGFVALYERIGFGVDAAHSSHVDEVAGAGPEVPGSGRLDGAGWR